MDHDLVTTALYVLRGAPVNKHDVLPWHPGSYDRGHSIRSAIIGNAKGWEEENTLALHDMLPE